MCSKRSSYKNISHGRSGMEKLHANKTKLVQDMLSCLVLKNLGPHVKANLKPRILAFSNTLFNSGSNSMIYFKGDLKIFCGSVNIGRCSEEI